MAGWEEYRAVKDPPYGMKGGQTSAWPAGTVNSAVEQGLQTEFCSSNSDRYSNSISSSPAHLLVESPISVCNENFHHAVTKHILSTTMLRSSGGRAGSELNSTTTGQFDHERSEERDGCNSVNLLRTAKQQLHFEQVCSSFFPKSSFCSPELDLRTMKRSTKQISHEPRKLEGENRFEAAKLGSYGMAGSGRPWNLLALADEVKFGQRESTEASVLTSTTNPEALNPPNSLGAGIPKVSKKRSRASRRPATTVLDTDSKNFRAMVQHLTGMGAATLSSASLLASIDRPYLATRISNFVRPKGSPFLGSAKNGYDTSDSSASRICSQTSMSNMYKSGVLRNNIILNDIISVRYNSVKQDQFVNSNPELQGSNKAFRSSPEVGKNMHADQNGHIRSTTQNQSARYYDRTNLFSSITSGQTSSVQDPRRKEMIRSCETPAHDLCIRTLPRI